jgi:hypothetical protein
MWPWSKKETSPPPAPLRDDVLGELVFCEGFWNGMARRGERDLQLSIVGNPSGPDPAGRERLIGALSRFDDLAAAAIEFLLKDLTPEERTKGSYDFRPTGIWSGAAWQVKQRSFTLTLELSGDKGSIWRVEIGPSGPLWTGRDS